MHVYVEPTVGHAELASNSEVYCFVRNKVYMM